MAFSSIASACVQGLHIEVIHAESDVSNGLPMFHMVGYLSSEVKEAAERVRTAIRNSGFSLPPKKIVVNLSPATVKKKGASPMKKHFRVSTALLAAVLLAGCGSISSKDGGYYATESPSAEGAYDTAAGAANSSIVPEELPDSTDETAQKIIYNADINMESTDFDAARDTLLAAVDDCGAWMEYSSLSGDAKDHDRYAYYTVRVPVENYRTFLAAVGEAGSVLDLSETAENITSSYIDVQARLSALEAQRERLNALADQAETTADLLEIESQLSDVQYQLENYTRQLKNMDQQVSYSTVDIRLSEVATLTPTGTTFGERVADAFAGGWHGFVAFLQGFVLAVIYLWPVLLVVGIIVALAVTLTKRRRKNHPKPVKPAAPAKPAEYTPQSTNDEPKPKY